MTKETKEYVKAVKSKGKHLICIPNSLIKEIGLNVKDDLLVKRYPTLNKKMILLRFKTG